MQGAGFSPRSKRRADIWFFCSPGQRVTKSDLTEAMPGIAFILARLPLLLRHLAHGPELPPVLQM